MSEAGWTKDRPTVPGFYWWKSTPAAEAEVVLLLSWRGSWEWDIPGVSTRETDRTAPGSLWWPVPLTPPPDTTRVVGWAEFAALPAGTLFSYYKPCVVDGLYVKGDTIAHGATGQPVDFFETSLIAGVEIHDGTFYVADGESRWGRYEYNCQFLVYGNVDRAHMAELVAP